MRMKSKYILANELDFLQSKSSAKLMIQMHEEAIPFSLSIQADRNAPKTDDAAEYSIYFRS